MVSVSNTTLIAAFLSTIAIRQEVLQIHKKKNRLWGAKFMWVAVLRCPAHQLLFHRGSAMTHNGPLVFCTCSDIGAQLFFSKP